MALLKRGVFVGWNWWLLGGYPTSTDIAQNFARARVCSDDDLRRPCSATTCCTRCSSFSCRSSSGGTSATRIARRGLVAGGLACFFAAGYFGPARLERRHQLAGGRVLRRLAMIGSRARALGTRWGGPLCCSG